MSLDAWGIRRVLLHATTAVVMVAGVQAQVALAADQPADDAQSGEIIVTATRQAQGLSKVPISVAAFNQKSLDQIGARRVDDIARLTPGLTLTTASAGAGTNQNISIRGISSTVGAATTGIYIDDTPIQTRALSNATTNTYPQLFDLERVEVLRGPQGTLFGAGAEGGVVRFITPQPGFDRYSGSARAELGSTEGGAASYELGAAVGGPIVEDKVGFRVSGIYRRDGGYVDRVDRFGGATHKNENINDSYNLRGALAFKPSEAITITAALMYQDTHAPGSPVYYENVSDPGDGRFANQFGTKQLRDDRFILPTLTIAADLGFADLISTTSYLDRKARIRADTTLFIPTVLFGNPLLYQQGETSYSTIRDRQKNWSQELRLQSKPGGRFSWTVGAFYQRARQRGSQVNFDPFADTLAVRLTGATIEQLTGIPLVNGTDLFHTDIASTDKQSALFGEASYEIADGLKLTAGARVARTVVNLSRTSSGPVAGAGGTFAARQAETPVTPRFGVSYQATPETMLYATAAKGFRVGGANSPILSLCQDAIDASGLTVGETYKSDSVWSYEVGAKTRTRDGKLAVSASAFNIDWSNIQTRISLTACGSAFTANLGKARSRGFDISFDLRPVDGLSLGLGVGYVDAKLTETVRNGAALFGADGDKLPVSPWSVSASARYEFALLDDKRAYLRADYQYNDGTPDPDRAVVGTDPLAIGDERFNQLSLRAGVIVGDFDISAFVNNALNEHPTLGRARDAVASPLFYAVTARPRTFGLTGSMHF